MTSPTSPTGTSPTGTSPTGPPSTAATARERWTRWRWPLTVALVVLLAALVAALTVRPPGDDARLGPDNPGPDGSRALVQVLRRQGVDVRVERRSAAAVAATGTGSTLLVTGTETLGRPQFDRLDDDDAAILVLVEPDEVALAALAPQIRTAGTTSRAQVVDPGCAAPVAVAAGPARAGGHFYVLDEGAEGDVCYPRPGGGDGGGDGGAYVATTRGARSVVVIGRSDVLTNQHLADAGDAALALRSLGANPSLVWYLPDPLEPSATEGGGGTRPTLGDLLPSWVFWVLCQLVVVAAVAIVWRARRLGRLVSEPLPVVVRAAETQEGRARLYRQARAHGRAGNTLRTGTLRRLAGRLAAPPGTTGDQLVAMVAAATGREPAGPAGLHALLLGPPPHSDPELVRLADDLDTLERDFSRHDRKGPPQ